VRPPEPPTAVTLQGLTKSFPASAAPAVDSLTLALEPGTLTALLGPSGCGKTTTLSMVAGLLDPDAGDILFGSQSVLSLPPERRPVAMVFQRALLFPHLTVADNIAFGLRMRHTPRRERHRQVAQMLDLVQLSGYGERRIHQLSGGQEQRVALARALITLPRVLLLDEPFSALDASLRTEMRALLRRVQQQLGLTTVFVTHDQDEAVQLADHIAFMVDGRVEQHAPPTAFFEQPATVQTARFFGAGNILRGQMRAGWFTCALGELAVATAYPDGPGTLIVRKEALQFTQGAARNTVTGRVLSAEYHGTHIAVDVAVAGVTVHLVVPPSGPVPVGACVAVHLPATACTVIPDGVAPP
jgi:putative spermidine/putrescine transport system ATP-binding protein